MHATISGPGSWLANTGLRGMVWVISLGGFLNRVGHTHTYWDALDPAVAASQELAQRLLWSDGGILTLAIGILACVCAWLGFRRKVAVCLNLAVTAFIVLLLGHATAFRGVETARWLRTNVTGVTDLFHNTSRDLDPAPISDITQRELLYRTWASAMFGDADSAAAKEYGPRLFDCMVWRWDEEQTTEIQTRKTECTRQLMAELKTKYPVASEYARGLKTGEQATTIWFLGLPAAVFVAGWEIFAGLAALVLNAACTFVVPAVAFLTPFALFRSGLKHLKHLGELLVGSAIKAAVCAVTAQLVAAAEGAILGSGSIPFILKVIFAGLIFVIAIWLTKRHRRLVNGAVDRQVDKVVRGVEKMAEVGANAAAVAAGLPPGMIDEFPKMKKGKKGRDAAAAGATETATAEAAVADTTRDGWVAPVALPAAGETVPAGQPPLAWEHGATGPAPGPGMYQRADGTWAGPGVTPAGALGPGPHAAAISSTALDDGRAELPAGSGIVHDPVIHGEEHRRLVEAIGRGDDPGTDGSFDRQLSGMYVADGRGLPAIDVHGWVAPATSTTSRTTTTQPGVTLNATPAAAPATPAAAPGPIPPMPRPIPPTPGGTP